MTINTTNFNDMSSNINVMGCTNIKELINIELTNEEFEELIRKEDSKNIALDIQWM
jgi:hypothetical protein